ncbi:MAG: DNA recombination protein RmuC [Deltaproteobacteria bacterium]|nr:DNA recombination protein RmuC [Candidatus Anaeroferrophillus wilburensis]MBN2889296.1 DNA recombination protein RmuC [Deltaproteobacteria bacterium]
MEPIAAFVAGLGLGMAIVILFCLLRRQNINELTASLVAAGEERRRQESELLIGRLKDSFSTISLNALTQSTQEFLKLANEALGKQLTAGNHELSGKKALIDETLGAMKRELDQVQTLVSSLEKDRELKFGELTKQLQLTSEQTVKLHETTGLLQTALAGTGSRGQWGERMAEDILRLAGFMEGVNYLKQQKLTDAATRPDYTFLLPNELKLNMDVKFPLNNYMKCLEATSDPDRVTYRMLFLKDVRQRIKEVTNRNYINPSDNTVDYMLVFIPNEQVYGFIHEHDQILLDDALKQKVVLCSPVSLYAILAVIRQAVDNFQLEKTAAQILSLMGSFNKQWDRFTQSFEKLGSKIEETRKEYDLLTTTRKRQLDRHLNKIEDLRRQQASPANEFETPLPDSPGEEVDPESA